ncbi:N-formylglutamate amidohydrolase [Desulfuromonas sp. TF]|uniref:N-formylglutamate amidohydrolase n=1 Tax=Desulfuromonas sp. TF TaxID=1232410 RepID=UPI000412172F|nr:N-formylglutamate amidohydrolase [Desulfuromonas sp. TF]
MAERRVVVSCEHGGNRVPERYGELFAGAGELLASHRGQDIGVLPLAAELAERLGVPLHAGTVTRLLVDLNRSPGSRTLFSEFTRDLPQSERERILARYYRPYREGVTAEAAAHIAAGAQVVHLSLHSFTPEWDGMERRADLGLLYDPRRPGELDFCAELHRGLRQAAPHLRVRRNYPYLGTSDSLVTTLRRRFPPASYLGIEIEVNQKHPAGDRREWEEMRRVVCEVLAGLTTAIQE